MLLAGPLGRTGVPVAASRAGTSFTLYFLSFPPSGYSIPSAASSKNLSQLATASFEIWS